MAVFGYDPGSEDHRDAVREVWDEDVYRLDGIDLTGKAVVDVGAHIGAFSIRCALAGARVVAIEPWPEAHAKLTANIEWNGVKHLIYPVQRAMAPKGFDGLTLAQSGTSGMGTVDGRLAGEGAHVVATIDPDEVAEKLATALGEGFGPEAEVLKVDIEGGEHDLFACPTMRRLLPKCKHVMIETHPGPNLGGIIEALLPSHHVDAFGDPAVGGMIYARRY